MPDANTTRPTRSRLFRVLRGFVLTGLVLLTLAALFYAEENFRGRRAWERYRQDAEARGIKLDFASHIPKPIPDAENGANTPFIQSWFPKPKPDGTNYWPELAGKAFANVAKRKNAVTGPGAQDARLFTDLVGWQQAFEYLESRGTNKPPKPDRPARASQVDPQEQAKAAAVVLEKLKIYEPALAELHAMKKLPHIRYPIDYKLEEPFSILLPHLAKIKGIIQELNLQACAELAAGRTDQAIESVRLMLWLCDSLDNEMFLISQLVCIAGRQIALQPIWEGLAQHKWSEAQLKEIQENMLRVNFISALDHCLADERAGGMTTIDWIRKRKMRGDAMAIFDMPEGGDGTQANAGRSLLGWVIPSGWFYFEMANFGRLMDTSTAGAWDIEARQIDARTVDANFARVTDQFKRGPIDSVWHHYMFARLLMPALEKSSGKFARAQSTAHQAALACAIERHRLANNKLPDSLADLAPKYLAKIPHQVVSPEPMRYRQTPDGFVLWSVGWDGKDDDGELLRAAKGGEPERGDWVWRSTP